MHSIRSWFSQQSSAQVSSPRRGPAAAVTTPRRNDTRYRPPSDGNLLGRVLVALSGKAARRERAIGRLELYVDSNEACLADIAVAKFKRDAAGSHLNAMLAGLTPKAQVALHRRLTQQAKPDEQALLAAVRQLILDHPGDGRYLDEIIAIRLKDKVPAADVGPDVNPIFDKLASLAFSCDLVPYIDETSIAGGGVAIEAQLHDDKYRLYAENLQRSLRRDVRPKYGTFYQGSRELRKMHLAQVFHRDIRLSNLQVTDAGKLKLTGWQLAYALDDSVNLPGPLPDKDFGDESGYVAGRFGCRKENLKANDEYNFLVAMYLNFLGDRGEGQFDLRRKYVGDASQRLWRAEVMVEGDPGFKVFLATHIKYERQAQVAQFLANPGETLDGFLHDFLRSELPDDAYARLDAALALQRGGEVSQR